MNACRYHADSSDDELRPLSKEESKIGLDNKNNIDGTNFCCDVADTADDKTSECSLLKATSLRQKLLLSDLVFTYFVLNLCISTPSPFFSRVVVSKGGTVFNSAIILQSLMVPPTIFGVVFGKLQSRIGCKNLAMFGAAVFGLSQFAFGFLQYIDDIITFTVVGTTLHLAFGIGTAGYVVSSLTIAFQEYSAYVSRVVGLYGAAAGTAFFVGPLFGGVLYDASGMCLPLTLSGGVALLLLPVHYAIIREDAVVAKTENGDFALLHFLSQPNVIMLLISYGCVSGIMGYYDIAFTIYVEKLGFSTSLAGVAMFITGITYGIFSGLVGCIVGIRSWLPTSAIIVGHMSFGATLLLFSPEQTRPLIYLGCACFGMASAVASVPVLERLINEANDNRSGGFDIQVYSAVSGITFTSLGLGVVLVPIISSYIQGLLGSFSNEMFTLAMLEFLIALMIVLLCVVKRAF